MQVQLPHNGYTAEASSRRCRMHECGFDRLGLSREIGAMPAECAQHVLGGGRTTGLHEAINVMGANSRQSLHANVARQHACHTLCDPALWCGEGHARSAGFPQRPETQTSAGWLQVRRPACGSPARVYSSFLAYCVRSLTASSLARPQRSIPSPAATLPRSSDGSQCRGAGETFAIRRDCVAAPRPHVLSRREHLTRSPPDSAFRGA